jgi:hypothetical protein
MTVYFMRIFIYTLLPLLTAAAVIAADRRLNTRARRLEITLIYLFGLGVAGSGIGGFFGHLFLSDIVAESVGWPAGSPFQLEMGFANLALGVLGFAAVGRRDGLREATVMAVTVIGVGASIVHFIDIFQTGNLAPGNTIQNVSNLAKPVLLISFLAASRKADKAQPEDPACGSAWRSPHLQAVGWMTGMVASGFGVGFAIELPVLGTAVGLALGALLMFLTLRRSRAAKK